MVPSPTDRDKYNRELAAAKAALDEGEFDADWNEGRWLTGAGDEAT